MMNGLQGALAALLFLSFQPAAGAADPNPLAQARQLYESASYEQALGVLDGLQPSDTSTMEEAQTARRYRVFCLVALDRNADAERVLEELVRTDLSDPVSSDLSPRVDTLVKKVRQRVAREMVKGYYEQGRGAYDRGRYAEAAARLGDVIKLFEDPALGLKTDPSLADLRVLADGFLTLSQALIPKPAPAPQAVATDKSSPAENPPPQPARTVAAVPGPPTQSARTVAAAPDPLTQPARTVAAVPDPPAQPARTAIADPPRSASPQTRPPDPIVYNENSGSPADGLIPPKRIAQPIPPFDPLLAGSPTRREGSLEIIVGVDGSVVSAEIKLPINPKYDALLVATAKQSWKYEPATRLGVPVLYRLRVKIVLAAR